MKLIKFCSFIIHLNFLKTNLKQINNKRTFVNLYSDPSTDFLYNVVYQQHIKIKIHAIQIYPFCLTNNNPKLTI